MRGEKVRGEKVRGGEVRRAFLATPAMTQLVLGCHQQSR